MHQRAMILSEKYFIFFVVLIHVTSKIYLSGAIILVFVTSFTQIYNDDVLNRK